VVEDGDDCVRVGMVSKRGPGMWGKGWDGGWVGGVIGDGALGMEQARDVGEVPVILGRGRGS